MNWNIKYRCKGSNIIIEKNLDLSFTNNKEISNWFKSAYYTKLNELSGRYDYILVGVHKVKNGKI